MKNLYEEALLLQDEMIQHRRILHAHPETGFNLTNTKAYVKKELEKLDYQVKEVGKSGLSCEIGNHQGKTFLLRADMDALPIQEQTNLEFKSTNDFMHACGHDMHTAMLLGAAKLLKQHENEIQGTVRFMFQPAEEIFEGSKDMIEHGILENVDGAMMIHVMANFPLEPGTVLISKPGVSAPAADYFTIKIHGKGTHGSMPNLGVDPINVAAHLITALQVINSRELALNQQAILTIGTIHAGNLGNVIPDELEMSGTIRTYDEQTRNFIKERMSDIIENVAKTFRATASLEFGSGCPTLVNDETLAKEVTNYAKALLGSRKAFSVEEFMKGSSSSSSGAGSEDFAYVSQEVPSIMLALAAGKPNEGYCFPQHHPQVQFDERALASGCCIFAGVALNYLKNH